MQKVILHKLHVLDFKIMWQKKREIKNKMAMTQYLNSNLTCASLPATRGRAWEGGAEGGRAGVLIRREFYRGSGAIIC